ncbi:DNA topoisomerase VI subunit B [Candidatus Bathyarchaeota archaeon]|nr:DNA topoisomerase VI subunit B [Candidatus Bathyarchaeota archaeon]MBS7613164.1 DNA topoisomerase VI subunit B [Candidatus Bathyarchaeota archaeon]MBS7617621.1 DNA topoisomerase VI subunit B [Candidatus Bathyarchaeota archaeon]
MVEFQEISPADFFYRNRDIAGFTNPARALYSTVRELVENSLDACESVGILPNIYVRLTHVSGPLDRVAVFKIRVLDNGSGVPEHNIPLAFGKVLYGSKYRLKQTRGAFGLGGKMAILYGQITTNKPVRIVSSTGSSHVYEYVLTVDIRKNEPKILGKKNYENVNNWRGVLVEFYTEGDYYRSSSRILDYLKQTAMVNPYAEIIFVDPRGYLHIFERGVDEMPPAPKETLPHPYGVDVEALKRIIADTKVKSLMEFMTTHFHRVGKATAYKFLSEAGLNPDMNPKKLSQEDIVKLVNHMKNFKGFLPPDASCLSPLGEKLLKAGIEKELKPEFVAVTQRKPSSYSGYPFIVEVGIAYGGSILKPGITLYRFSNKIPLLYDETSDVSWKVLNEMIDWSRYKVEVTIDPVAVIVHICSTKIPYKTVGKEFIADRPEIEHEIINGVRIVARQLMLHLSRKKRVQMERARLEVFSKYLDKLTLFSTRLAGRKKPPDLKPLLAKIARLNLVKEEQNIEEEQFEEPPIIKVKGYEKK